MEIMYKNMAAGVCEFHGEKFSYEGLQTRLEMQQVSCK